MGASRFTLSLCLAAALSSCGGSSAAPTAGTPTPTPSASPTPTPSPTSAACSLSSRENWALTQLQEWYLFPDLFNAAANPAAYSTLQDYVDALVAPARAQSKDRYFTYVTSIAEENAFYDSGSSAGFGFRLGYDTSGGRVFVVESFEGGPALGQNIDRGDELLAVGSQTVSTLMSSGGPSAVVNALGPSDPGVSRVLRVRSLSGTEREVTLTKTEFDIDPVSTRYGAKVIDSGGTKVAYLNMRNFIGPSDPQLRSAFQTFKSQGITRIIVDLRYNGGGLVSIAELMGDLLAANRAGSVFSYTTFRSSKSQYNETHNFGAQSQAIAATRIAFIGTGATASASELVMNAMPPYLAGNVALVGTNTYGKPVGQIALDLKQCDDRLRAIAFKTDNADHQGEYFFGLADTMPVTCRATDDIGHQLGDPAESSVAAALSWLGGASCTAIGAGPATTQAAARREMLQPVRPTAAQHEVPGLF